MGCSISSDKCDEADIYTKTQQQQTPNGGHFDDHYFTQRQKQIIRETWEKVNSNQVEKGVEIFLIIFEKKPEAKMLFPFRRLEGDSLITNSTFRMHSRRFMDAIRNTVEHLDALDVSCGPTFVLLGRKHSWIKDFMTAGYLEAFVGAIATVFERDLSDCKTGEVYDAWHTLFSFLVTKLCEGYQQASKTTEISNSDPTYKSSVNHSEALPNDASECPCHVTTSNDNAQSEVNDKRNCNHSGTDDALNRLENVTLQEDNKTSCQNQVAEDCSSMQPLNSGTDCRIAQNSPPLMDLKSRQITDGALHKDCDIAKRVKNLQNSHTKEESITTDDIEIKIGSC